MQTYKTFKTVAGWLVFAIAAAVYYFTAESTGSLWDCGEFILGAYKMQVVHPPGAPTFLLVARLFTWVAEMVSDKPEAIAFSVNFMSGVATAFAAALVCWITAILSKMALKGREGEPTTGESIAIAGAGLVAGLTTAFCTSIWFSAVEGEVYAMSTFFTALTLWCIIRWYELPNEPEHDRWLFLTLFVSSLSIGVHLLSILTFPALALFYYYKRYKNITLVGTLAAAGAGVGLIVLIQKLVITGLPALWAKLELATVNGLGLPFHSGLILALLLVGGAIVFGLRWAQKNNHGLAHYFFFGAALVYIGYSVYGVVVIRANANPPINMNNPSDAMSLLPYLNREQYGERPLLYGPDFEGRPIRYDYEDRYGRVGDKYEVVDRKPEAIYDSRDKTLFPRLSDYSQGRPGLYKQWLGLNPEGPMPEGRPNLGDNLRFFFKYQVNWMYWRYFMWNFSGRQNGSQGYYSWDKSSGNWISGIAPIDNARLYDQSLRTEAMRNDKARNVYYMIPFLLGLVGLFFHFNTNNKEAFGLLAMFIITGLGIIVYSNQPPNEPRERDYVLVGSFFTYSIWVGMSVIAIFRLLSQKAKLSSVVAAPLGLALALTAPLLMGTQNFDDHSRRDHTGARDYAVNFLESCEPNAIVFTYGDNDTYPLWYAQEVENIRTDVRVVNLSLIAVDWYINNLRRKINNSPAIDMTIPKEALRGDKRNQIFIYGDNNEPVKLADMMKFVGEDHPLPLQGGSQTETYIPSNKAYIPVDIAKAKASGQYKNIPDSLFVSAIPISLPQEQGAYLTKADIAVLDIINNNFGKRPIYYAVTCRPEIVFGMQDYTELQGLALKLVPYKGANTGGQQLNNLLSMGRVNTDVAYNNLMTKFKWGGFDKKAMFVDESYQPGIQSLRYLFSRMGNEFNFQGDKDKAVKLADKYFQVFPAYNFEYDYWAMNMASVYVRAGANDKAKQVMDKIAAATLEKMTFFTKVGNDVVNAGFSNEYAMASQVMNELISNATFMGDTKLRDKYNNMFKPYMQSQNQLQQLMN